MAAPLLVVGVVVELHWGGGTVADLVGTLLAMVVLVALGVSLWRRAGAAAAQPGGRSVPAPASREAAGS